MPDHDKRLHIETDRARAGATPHVVRWVLASSLTLVIVVFILLWVLLRVHS